MRSNDDPAEARAMGPRVREALSRLASPHRDALPGEGADRPVLVLGVGSDLRSDDGVGPWVADRLEQIPGPWQVVSAMQLLPEHAEAIASAEPTISEPIGAPRPLERQTASTSAIRP